MKGFMAAFGARLDTDESFLLGAYDDVSEHMVTDCPIDVLVSITDRYRDYQFKEIISPEGENSVGTDYMEFYVDEEKLDDLIIRLFYDKKEI